MNSPELPFKLQGGETEQAAMHNRIAAIDRINYLVGNSFDLRKKSKEYLYLLDMEMYQRWYKNEPKDKRINEDYCQRACEVIKAMEADVINTKEALVDVKERVKQSYRQHESLPLKEVSCKSGNCLNKKETYSKQGIIQSFLKRWRRKSKTEESTPTQN